MVLKKMDALEFVESQFGKWDCIIFDPPYLESIPNKKNTKDNSNYDFMVSKEDRTKIDQDYLDRLLTSIEIKSDYNFCLLKFYYKPLFDANLTINWYKYEMGALAGNKIQKNTEYINFYYYNYKPDYKKAEMLPETIAMRRKYGINANKEKPYEKPIKLYEKLFKYLNPTKVLDPFAGSYNSAKVCNNLGIEIDSCDKYLDPPDLLGLEKFMEK